MSKENKRRSFLKKTALTAIGGSLLAKGVSAMNTTEKKEVIIKTRPLGFQWETQDPFLFCVHHEDYYPKGNDEMGPNSKDLKGRNLGSDFNIKDGWRMYHGRKVPGFPGHPHRGFETITVVRKGMVDHTDSMGASGRYGNGDVQWMTAGKGVQHAEMFPLIKKDEENTMELFQIWLNLPSKDKFVEPHFKMLWNETIPKLVFTDSNNKNIYVEVIAGQFNETKPSSPPPNSWAANNSNEVAVWNIKLDAGATYKLPKTSKGVNRTIYFYAGDSLQVNETSLAGYHAADVLAEEIQLTAGAENCNILILQGKPIAEPVVQHGPFVMNSRQEIQQAFEDYQKTQFGGWPWPAYDQVHDRSKGRFAKHSDGTLEEKS